MDWRADLFAGAARSLAVGDFAQARRGDRFAAMTRLAIPCAPALLLLAACGDAGDEGPEPVSVEEAQALEDAASMLDEQRLETEVAPENNETELPEEE